MPKYFHSTERISMKRRLSTLIVIACALSLAAVPVPLAVFDARHPNCLGPRRKAGSGRCEVYDSGVEVLRPDLFKDVRERLGVLLAGNGPCERHKRLASLHDAHVLAEYDIVA